MGCTSCKQKNTKIPIEEIQVVENTQFKLRNQITFEELNLKMTDEKIIEFLKENPNRISLFSEFPDNWKELINVPAIAGTSKEFEVKSITLRDNKKKKNISK